MSAPTGIELFSGCGGLSTGFLDAGVNVAAGFDIDRRSIETYSYNHQYRAGGGHVLDLSRTTGETLLAAAGVAHVDVLIGGPPCQPFSIVGKRRGSEDERAGLVADFLRLTNEIRPDALMFENVPNLATIDEGRILRGFVSGLERLGYRVTFDIRAAAGHGVPQMRRRLLLVAAMGFQPKLPPQTHAPTEHAQDGRAPFMTCKDALSDLPEAADFGECGIYNHEPTQHSADMLARFADLQPGRREPRSFHDRLHPDRPSYTLRAGSGNFSPLRPVHYKVDRVITVRESARLQGFSDDFIWPDSIPRLQQYRQVGNAVPPPVARDVAMSLGAQMGWDLDPARFRGDSDARPPAITLTDAERRHRRSSRLRGASLGKMRE